MVYWSKSGVVDMDWSRIIDALVKYIGIPAFMLSIGLALREVIKSSVI